MKTSALLTLLGFPFIAPYALAGENPPPPQETIIILETKHDASALQSEQNQRQRSEALSYVETDPYVNQRGYQSNYQINSAFGVEEWPSTTMANVGSVPNAYIGFTGGYSGFDDGYWGNTGAYDVRVVAAIPLGTRIDDDIEELAKREVALREAEVAQANVQVIAQQIDNWTKTVELCVGLQHNSPTSQITIDPANASPVIQDIYSICQGLNVTQVVQEVNELEHNLNVNLEKLRQIRRDTSTYLEVPN